MKQSIRTSFLWFSLFRFIFRFFSMRFSFSTFSRSFFVCKNCQKRFVIYRFIDWIMSNVFKIENNEIFMKRRYWNFVSFCFTLKKYWFFWNYYFEKINMLFVFCFVRSFHSINRWSIMIWKNIKIVILMNSMFRLFRSVIWKNFTNCCMFCLLILLFNEYDRNLLLLWFRLDLTRLIIVFIFYYFLKLQSLDKYEKKNEYNR